MGKAWRFFKETPEKNIDREKYVFVLLFAWKTITFGSLLEIRGHPQIHLFKNSGLFSSAKGGGGYSLFH